MGYADEVAAHNLRRQQLMLEMVIRSVKGWMKDHGSSPALDKTEVVALIKKRIQIIIPKGVGEFEIEAKPKVK